MAVSAPSQGHGSRVALPIRYVMAILGSIGLAIIYGFKVNVSIAILKMVNQTALQGATNIRNSSDEIEDGPFEWSKQTQGMIHSMYYVGYLVSLIPSGLIAEKVSARWVMNYAVIINAIASILSPIAASMHASGFGLMRLIQGLGGGASFPAMHVMIAKWAPPNERNVIGSIIYAGTALGTVISLLLTGLIAASMTWESVFYIEGALSFIWSAVWWIVIQDSPADQKRFISVEEKTYILNSLGSTASGHGQSKKRIPLKKVMLSVPFIALLITHVCNNCGWYMLLTQLPTYMNDILGFDLKTNAGLSSLPYFCMWLFTLILSYILTKLQGKKIISMTYSRKIGTFFAAVVPMICLIIVSYVSNAMVAVALMTVSVTCMGGMYCGFLANHIDIAPNFAGTLIAITNTLATIPGIVMPIVVGELTATGDRDSKIIAWRIIFFVTAFFYLIEIIVFSVFGTATEQPWNNSVHNNSQPKSPKLKTNAELEILNVKRIEGVN